MANRTQKDDDLSHRLLFREVVSTTVRLGVLTSIVSLKSVLTGC